MEEDLIQIFRLYIEALGDQFSLKILKREARNCLKEMQKQAKLLPNEQEILLQALSLFDRKKFKEEAAKTLEKQGPIWTVIVKMTEDEFEKIMLLL
jgi:hypothetical protein